MIFISYSWRDSHLARLMERRLSEAGKRVWIDYRFLDLSHPLESQIRSAVEAASQLLIIDSSHARASSWVQFELSWALHTGVPLVGLHVRQQELNGRPNWTFHPTAAVAILCARG